jgi:uncharacterized membrane protein
MDAYTLLKTLHIIGVIVFIGNIIVTGWWKVMADKTKNPTIIAFAQRQVTLTDWVFTFGGVTLLGGSAAVNVWIHDIPLSTPWVQWGFAIFCLSGLIWVAVLVPLQWKLSAMTRKFTPDSPIPARYWRLEALWLVFGFIDTVLPLAVVPLMVGKIG